MPREPFRNGRDGRKRRKGRSKEHVVVECGVNELGDCFREVCGRGSAGAGELALCLGRHVPDGSRAVTDGHPSYGLAARRWPHRVVDPGDPSTGNINMVNALHSRLKGLLAPFRGVATRRLQRYLDWFCYRERFKRTDADRRELLFRHEGEGVYWLTRRLTHFELCGAMVYWNRRYERNVNAGLTWNRPLLVFSHLRFSHVSPLPDFAVDSAPLPHSRRRARDGARYHRGQRKE